MGLIWPHHWDNILLSPKTNCCLVPSVMFNSLQPIDCSPPVSSAHGILQAKILEWVAIPFSRGSPWPRDWTHISYLANSLPLYHLGSPLRSISVHYEIFPLWLLRTRTISISWCDFPLCLWFFPWQRVFTSTELKTPEEYPAGLWSLLSVLTLTVLSWYSATSSQILNLSLLNSKA